MQTSGKRTGAALTVLLALVIAMAAELIKFSGPQFDYLMGSGGVILAAVLAIVTYAAPAFITPVLLRRRPPSGTTIVGAVALLVVVRIVLQFLTGNARVSVGLVAVALSISTVVIVAAVASRFGGVLVARGVAAGLFLSAAISLVQSTFDSIWRYSFLGYLPAFVVAVAAVAVALVIRTIPSRGYSRGLWAIGPVLSLGVTVFANPAFISSQAGIPLWAATVALLLGFFFTTILLRSKVQLTLVLAVSVVLSIATIYFVPRWPEPQTFLVSLIVVLFSAILAVSSIGLLAVLAERSAQRTSVSPLAGASAGAGLLVIMPTLLFQLDYDIPLGFPNKFIMVALGLVLAIPALVASRREARFGSLPSQLDLQVTSRAAQLAHVGGLAVISVVIVAGAIVVAPKTSSSTDSTAQGSYNLLDWNLHYGVSLEGSSTWDDMAHLIKNSGADVVTLQEISRGWIMGNGGDMLTYLANQLGMEYSFVGAADLQFGNAILWSPGVNMSDLSRTTLEYGDGPQHRSALAGVITVGQTEITLATAHLQHRDENTPTRMIQISDMSEGLAIGDNAIVTGDFNAEPGWPEIIHFTDQGFSSAIDETGDPNAMTFPANAADVRIDWVFSRGVTLGETKVLQSNASDHLPISTSFSFN